MNILASAITITWKRNGAYGERLIQDLDVPSALIEIEASYARTFDSRDERHLSRTPMVLDEQGWLKVSEVLDETLETIIGRLAKNDPEYLKRYPLDVRVELFQGLLRALQFAHSHGIIHRNARAEISVEKLQSEGCAASVRN